MARADGSPKDVDREAIEMFEEFDENTSWFFDENIAKHATKPESVHKSTSSTFADPFYISNLRETINGFSFGNGPMLTFKKGERVRWYIMSSTNFEIHAPHWHGNVVTSMHMRTDVLALLPMGMIVADMVPDNPGVWLFHCHIGPHLNGGMSTRYTVLDNASAVTALPPTHMRTHH
jgi:hephaestin